MPTWMPSPYARQMANAIVSTLRLFDGRLPDANTHKAILAIASDPKRWPEAHTVRGTIRRRLLAAVNPLEQAQYNFAESCLESLYNETEPDDPFDSVSPFWVVPRAVELAKMIDVPIDAVMDSLRT